MSLNVKKLFDFLDGVDEELTCDMVLVAAGGTAMTLLDAKPSTIDVDFTVQSKHYDEFKRAVQSADPGLRVDIFQDGAIFVTVLPADYLERSIKIKKNFKNIELRALHPTDVILTKIARLDERDRQDIGACIEKFDITEGHIEQRAEEMRYNGDDPVFIKNLKAVLGEFFD